jgi:membrane fusion protein (multidrug efflux system)
MLEVGARVRGSEDVLTTIDVLDPIYVTFRPSGQQLLAWRRDPKSNRQIQPGGDLKVEAILPDGSTAPTVGRIGFVDPVLDPATGTQAFRAEFPNAQRPLLPGQFVRCGCRHEPGQRHRGATTGGVAGDGPSDGVRGHRRDTVRPREVVASA